MKQNVYNKKIDDVYRQIFETIVSNKQIIGIIIFEIYVYLHKTEDTRIDFSLSINNTDSFGKANSFLLFI